MENIKVSNLEKSNKLTNSDLVMVVQLNGQLKSTKTTIADINNYVLNLNTNGSPNISYLIKNGAFIGLNPEVEILEPAVILKNTTTLDFNVVLSDLFVNNTIDKNTRSIIIDPNNKNINLILSNIVSNYSIINKLNVSPIEKSITFNNKQPLVIKIYNYSKVSGTSDKYTCNLIINYENIIYRADMILIDFKGLGVYKTSLECEFKLHIHPSSTLEILFDRLTDLSKTVSVTDVIKEKINISNVEEIYPTWYSDELFTLTPTIDVKFIPYLATLDSSDNLTILVSTDSIKEVGFSQSNNINKSHIRLNSNEICSFTFHLALNFDNDLYYKLVTDSELKNYAVIAYLADTEKEATYDDIKKLMKDSELTEMYFLFPNILIIGYTKLGNMLEYQFNINTKLSFDTLKVVDKNVSIYAGAYYAGKLFKLVNKDTKEVLNTSVVDNTGWYTIPKTYFSANGILYFENPYINYSDMSSDSYINNLTQLTHEVL